MGDNNYHQEASCSTSSPSTRKRFSKVRKVSGGKLPTPPPDPTLQDSDDVFITSNTLEYINALQKTMFTSVIATEDAFDHLDKLYKLMEQMLDLRQQNARLLNRIRDLEHLRNLGVMHHQLNALGNVQDFDDDTVFAESFLDSILAETKKDFKSKPWTRSRLTQSVTKRQARGSTDSATPSFRKLSSSSSSREKQSKVSKWTKVKAAFRWEKASPSVTGAKSQDSGIGGMTPINFEVARYLRVPSSDETGNSPADSGAADGSTPGSLSSASSNDDVHRQVTRRDSQFSDEDLKCTPRKDVRSSTKRNINRTEHCQEDPSNANQSEDEKLNANDKEYYPNSQRSSVKSANHSQKRAKVQIPADVVERYQKAVADDEYASKNANRKRISKWVRVKKAFLNPAMDDQRNKVPPSLTDGVALYKTTDEKNKIQEEIEDNYKQLQNKLSLEFKEKLFEWEKFKASGSGATSNTYSRIDSVSEEQHDPAFAKKMEEWEKIKTQPLVKPAQCAQIIREEDLPPEFKKKLEEWQRIKKCPAKDDLVSASKTKRRLGEWPRWKSVSGHRDDHTYNEPQPLSDDFLKKLEEWRKIKESNKHPDLPEKTPSPSTSRKRSITTPVFKPKIDQNLQWFESELDKIEAERRRLVSEKQKFLQREERFEGISKKFTQKLCEWEESQGIGPEASTFALLTSRFAPHITVNLCDKEFPDQKPRLHRSKSAESLAVSHLNEVFQATSHHPSSLSLNDIDELERQCLALSTSSSYQNISRQSLENVDIDEPEAVIVEVEDVEEETAAPLEEYLEEKHFPIYQRESMLNTCEKQQLVIPDIQQATSSTNSHYCFTLIEEMLKLVMKLKSSDTKLSSIIQEDTFCIKSIDVAGFNVTDKVGTSTNKQETVEINNRHALDVLFTKLVRLREIHSKSVSNISKSEEQLTTSNFACISDTSQELFAQLFQMIERLQTKRTIMDVEYSSRIDGILEKLLELKQVFAYFHTNFDITRPRQLKDIADKHVCESLEDVLRNIATESHRSEADNEIEVDPEVVQKFVISTSTNYLNPQEASHTQHEPTSVFVNTTRRLFTPLEDVELSESPTNSTTSSQSSATQRKLPKEISPGIRVMLAKYNQMITGQDLPKSSSGSSSPVAWRSPVSERRVKAQRERYIEELSKIKSGRDVMKSASSAVLNLNRKLENINADVSKGILRSTSVSVIQKVPSLTFEIKQPTGERYNKLQKAKEEFMRSPEMMELPSEPYSAPPTCSKELMFTPGSRFSQVSMESGSSYESSACALIKSASAGMINVDNRDPAVHQYGYLSLPRVPAKQKGGLFEGLSNIAAKFRKVKMKRNKKMNAVSALCRQSLVVDLDTGSQENVGEHARHDSLTVPTPSSSEDTSPSSSRSGSWIRRSRIFKAL